MEEVAHFYVCDEMRSPPFAWFSGKPPSLRPRIEDFPPLLPPALPSAVIPPHPVWPQRSAWRDDPCPGPAAELAGPHEQHLRSHGLQAAGHLYVCQHGQMLLIGIAKVTGHLQPHFLAVCLPDPASFCCESGYITKHNCTGHWRRSSRPGEWVSGEGTQDASTPQPQLMSALPCPSPRKSFYSKHAFGMYSALYLVVSVGRRHTPSKAKECAIVLWAPSRTRCQQCWAVSIELMCAPGVGRQELGGPVSS